MINVYEYAVNADTTRLVDLWLQAETHNRYDNIEKANELKGVFIDEYRKLPKEHQQAIDDYLNSVGA